MEKRAKLLEKGATDEACAPPAECTPIGEICDNVVAEANCCGGGTCRESWNNAWTKEFGEINGCDPVKAPYTCDESCDRDGGSAWGIESCDESCGGGCDEIYDFGKSYTCVIDDASCARRRLVRTRAPAPRTPPQNRA